MIYPWFTYDFPMISLLKLVISPPGRHVTRLPGGGGASPRGTGTTWRLAQRGRLGAACDLGSWLSWLWYDMNVDVNIHNLVHDDDDDDDDDDIIIDDILDDYGWLWMIMDDYRL